MSGAFGSVSRSHWLLAIRLGLWQGFNTGSRIAWLLELQGGAFISVSFVFTSAKWR